MLEINYEYVNQDVQLFGEEYILTHTQCMENVGRFHPFTGHEE